MKRNDALKLGFDSYEELVLYYDVCIDLCRFDKYEETSIPRVRSFYTKKECIDILNKYNLMDLFNEVKDKSLYERLTQIFLYQYNTLQVYREFIDIYCNKLSDAIDYFNGKACIESYNKIMELNELKDKYEYVVRESLKRTKRRLTEEENNSLNEFLQSINYYEGGMTL